MRSGQLHQSLHAFSIEAAQALTAATAGGAEVGFDIVEERARLHRPALYCYRPLTGQFVARQWPTLRSLPSAASALAELSGMPGLHSYLAAHAPPADDDDGCDFSEAALQCFIGRVFDGADKAFVLVPERFEPAYRELFENAVERRNDIALLGLLRGVSTTAREIVLGDGMLLAPLERLGRVPPDPSWLRDDRPSLVVAVDPGEEPDGVERALAQMLELQTAMRLYAGGISLAPLAWIHCGGSNWRALQLGGGRTDGQVLLVAEQQEQLSNFIATVARRRPTAGALGWALRRFELGCEHENRLDALTDHLLALRALLEPEGAGSGRLAGRLAALCAEAGERDDMTRRILRAVALEQAVIAGEEIAPSRPDAGAGAVATEVEERLRQILRDVIAGELRGDLAALADARIYVPEDDAGIGHVGDFQVTRTSTGRFASGLFATPRTSSRPGVGDDSLFAHPGGTRGGWDPDEPPTDELRTTARG
jgi:stage V sporulation protein SpoVS